MKINTKVPASEMAIKVPDDNDLAAIKAAIPNADTFPLPTPDQVLDNYYQWRNETGYAFPISSETRQFITGEKRKGQGKALASYPTIYDNAIVHLQNLWEMKDDPQRVRDYLLDNPIAYKKDKNPELAKSEDGTLNIPMYVSYCITNLMEWLYLSSAPCYQYLRENLLEKARHIRKLYSKSDVNYGSVRVLPQRPTTSRNLGEHETNIHEVNAGYRVTVTEDPWTNSKLTILELVTWFYTNSKTECHAFKDYFDVENGDINAAIRKMETSQLYLTWARSMSPREYDSACNIFRIPVTDIAQEIEGLTKLHGDKPDAIPVKP